MIAILLHCFFLSTFAWLFVQGLHIYRMQTEARNINFGAMRFYYAIGWGVPAIITGKSCLCTAVPKPAMLLLSSLLTTSYCPAHPLGRAEGGLAMVSSAGSKQCCGGQGNMYQGLSSCLLRRSNFSAHPFRSSS